MSGAPDKLARRLRLMLGRGIIRLVNDAKAQQLVQLAMLAGETRDGIERFQDYGFTSVPLDGAEAIYAALGGRRDHLVVIRADDRRHRMTDLEPGESAHHNHLGDYIKIKNGRIVEVVAGAKLDVTAPEAVFHCSTKVTLETPECEITGNLTVGGNTDITGDTTVGGDATVTGRATVGALTSTGEGGGSDVTGGLGVDGITFGSHTHGGVEPGAGSTGGPQ